MDGRRVDLWGAPFGLRPYRVRNLSKVRGCWERPVCRSVSVEERPILRVLFYYTVFLGNCQEKNLLFGAGCDKIVRECKAKGFFGMNLWDQRTVRQVMTMFG